MKLRIHFISSLTKCLFLSFLLVPNALYAQSSIPQARAAYTKVTNAAGFKDAVNNALAHLKTSFVLQVYSTNLNTYSAVLDSVKGINSYHLSLVSKGNSLYLTVKLDYKQAYKLTQYLSNPNLESCLTKSDKQLLNLAQSIVSKITTKSMSDYEKELAIHDYIVNTTSYDYDHLKSNTLPSSAFTAYGVLVNKKAVCEGYSEATKLLCNIAGIPCEIITGSSSSFDLHAWNIVKLDNSWYMVDTTYDDPVCFDNGRRTELLSHEYFNVTSEMLSKDHSWNTADYPQAINMHYNYYYVSNSFITSYAQFKAFIISQITEGNTDIACYISGYNPAIYNLDFIFDYYSGTINYLAPESSSGCFRLILS